MRSQRSINKKAAKARARRRDFVWRKNINANVPMEAYTEKRELYQPVVDRHTGRAVISADGRAMIRHVGYKEVTKKLPVYNFHEDGKTHIPQYDDQNRMIGMIQYPKPRKFHAKKLVGKS